jgi:hypothetical protein
LSDAEHRRLRHSGTEWLRNRIEETRAASGHPLRCSGCDRISSGKATGWTMYLRDGSLDAFCPECDELESG